jgi:hypothetical protein
MLAAVAREPKAYGIWHDIRVLEGQARRRADAAPPLSIIAWFKGVALKAAVPSRRNSASGATRAR